MRPDHVLLGYMLFGLSIYVGGAYNGNSWRCRLYGDALRQLVSGIGGVVNRHALDVVDKLRPDKETEVELLAAFCPCWVKPTRIRQAGQPVWLTAASTATDGGDVASVETAMALCLRYQRQGGYVPVSSLATGRILLAHFEQTAIDSCQHLKNRSTDGTFDLKAEAGVQSLSPMGLACNKGAVVRAQQPWSGQEFAAVACMTIINSECAWVGGNKSAVSVLHNLFNLSRSGATAVFSKNAARRLLKGGFPISEEDGHVRDALGRVFASKPDCFHQALVNSSIAVPDDSTWRGLFMPLLGQLRVPRVPVIPAKTNVITAR